LDVTPWVGGDGANWGDAEIDAYKAQAQIGESIVDYRLPNRQISVPMVLKDAGGTTFATIRSYAQAKAALWQRERGIGKRILATGGTVYFDVVASGLTLSGGWLQAQRSADNEAELRLEAIPDFYEPEVELASAEEKTAAELIKVIPDPGGDMPARVRIVVEEKQGADQRGLIWSLRSRHYSSATTAKVAYEAEELQVLDAARKVALSGASGGTVVQHGTISVGWTPIVGGRIGGTAWPTHTGTNRIFARVYSASGTLAQARLVWDVGDLVHPVENAPYRLPGASDFYIADLGEVRLDKAPVGTHRWDWQIQAKGEEGNEDFKVDRVWIVNTDEGMGRLTSPVSSGPDGFSAFSTRDEFNQTSGTLTGKVLPTGGTWTGAGDSDDFTLDATSHVVQRTATSDTTTLPTGGRLALAGTASYSSIIAQVDFKTGATLGSQGLLLRYKDTSNFLWANVQIQANRTNVQIAKRIAGSGTNLVSHLNPLVLPINTWYTLRFVALASGQWAFWLFRAGGSPSTPLYAGTDSAIATGGALASGLIGFYDYWVSPSENTRSYNNFAAWVPTPDAVLFASRAAQLTTDGMCRLDSGGSAYGPVSRVVGDLPRLPAGGLEGRSAELFIKQSRGDLGELPDTAMDDMGVKVYAERSWLTVPGTI